MGRLALVLEQLAGGAVRAELGDELVHRVEQFAAQL
jgi:hypothetical protein